MAKAKREKAEEKKEAKVEIKPTEEVKAEVKPTEETKPTTEVKVETTEVKAETPKVDVATPSISVSILPPNVYSILKVGWQRENVYPAILLDARERKRNNLEKDEMVKVKIFGGSREGVNALVFPQFLEFIGCRKAVINTALRNALDINAEIEKVEIVGKVSNEERDRLMEQHRPTPEVLIGIGRAISQAQDTHDDEDDIQA